MGILRSYQEGKLTELNNLKYGLAGTTDAPLVTKSIPTTVNGSGHSTNAINARVDDLVRITKILTKAPGLKYLANETALNALKNTPKFDPSRTFVGNLLNIAGNSLLNTAKIVGSTLAQVPVNGTGTHFVKGFAGTGKNTYLSSLGVAPHASAIKGSPVFLDYNASSTSVNSNLSNFETGPHLSSRIGSSAYGYKTAGVSTALNGLAATGIGFLGGLNLGGISSLLSNTSNIVNALGPFPYLPNLGASSYLEIKNGGSTLYLDYDAGSTGVNSSTANLEEGPHLASKVGVSKFGFSDAANVGVNSTAGTGIGNVGGLNLTAFTAANNLAAALVQPGPNSPFLSGLPFTPNQAIKEGQKLIYNDTPYNRIPDGSETQGGSYINPQRAFINNIPDSLLFNAAQNTIIYLSGLSTTGYQAASAGQKILYLDTRYDNIADGSETQGGSYIDPTRVITIQQPDSVLYNAAQETSPYLSGLPLVPYQAIRSGQQFLYLDTRYDNVADGSETQGGSYIDPTKTITGRAPASILYEAGKSSNTYPGRGTDLAASTAPRDITQPIYPLYINTPGEARFISIAGSPVFLTRTAILDDTTTPPEINALDPLKGKEFDTLLGQEYSNIRPDTLGNVSTSNGEGGRTTEVVDYRQLPNRNYRKNTYSMDYKSVKKEVRLNLGDPGRKKRINTYNQTNEGALDVLNALSPYKGAEVRTDSQVNDIIKFRFTVISSDGVPANDTHLHFRAFLDSFNDAYTGNWNNFNYIGRGEQFSTYSSFNRNISFGFKIAAQTRAEMAGLYQKMVWLASTTAPTYGQEGYMKGTLVKVTVGDYLVEMPGYFSSITYDIPQDSNWEILQDPNGLDSTQQQLPMYMTCTVSFTPIHRFTPQTGYYHYFTSDDPTRRFFKEDSSDTATTDDKPVVEDTQPEPPPEPETFEVVSYSLGIVYTYDKATNKPIAANGQPVERVNGQLVYKSNGQPVTKNTATGVTTGE